MEEIKILLVEDEKKIAESLKKGLSEQGYYVEVAYDGLIGKKLFETYPFDLIILDCPPALDLLTLNVLVAANSLIVPMQAEYFALEGITELISTLDRVRAAF